MTPTRHPQPTDEVTLDRDGRRVRLALGDLGRLLPQLETKETPAQSDLVLIYDAADNQAKAATLGSLP